MNDVITTVRFVYYEDRNRIVVEVPAAEFGKVEIIGPHFGVEVLVRDDMVDVSGDYMHIMPVASNHIYVIGENPHE